MTDAPSAYPRIVGRRRAARARLSLPISGAPNSTGFDRPRLGRASATDFRVVAFTGGSRLETRSTADPGRPLESRRGCALAPRPTGDFVGLRHRAGSGEDGELWTARSERVAPVALPGCRGSATSGWARTSATGGRTSRPRSTRSRPTASRCSLLLGLRDRAGRRGARPARLLQRLPARADRAGPEALLDACKAVERELGRDRRRRSPRAAPDRRRPAAARERDLRLRAPDAAARAGREPPLRARAAARALALPDHPWRRAAADALALLADEAAVRRVGEPLALADATAGLTREARISAALHSRAAPRDHAFLDIRGGPRLRCRETAAYEHVSDTRRRAVTESRETTACAHFRDTRCRRDRVSGKARMRFPRGPATPIRTLAVTAAADAGGAQPRRRQRPRRNVARVRREPAPRASSPAGRASSSGAQVAERQQQAHARADLQVGRVGPLAAEHAVADPAVDALEVRAAACIRSARTFASPAPLSRAATRSATTARRASPAGAGAAASRPPV